MRLTATSSLRAAAGVAGRLLPGRLRVRLERDPILLILVPLLAAALLMRLSNAVRYPSLHGFDSYAHATYIWQILKTWTVPLAADGWGRFHPPLYYWLTAGLWWCLSAIPPNAVLKILNVFYGAVGLVSALVAASITRRYLRDEPMYAWAAALFIVCLPVHIYTAPMLGNEGLSTVSCSVAVLLLVRLLQRQDAASALLLGVTLGLAMLTKFTAIVIVGSTGVTLVLWAILTGRYKATAGHLSIVVLCVLAVSGWFYGRNVMLYGNPFQMSRDYFATKRIEATIPKGNRDLSSYLTFDTAVLRHPSYANGPVLDNVWAGAYATAWFDAHGGWFFPSALYDSLSYRVGRVLMVMGLVPTFLIVLGLVQGLLRVRIREPDPVLFPLLVTTACMMAMFVIYTHENRIYTAVKASYLLPAIVPLSFWFALGLRTVAGWGWLLREGTVVALVAMAAFVIPVFTYQLVFEVPMGSHYWNSLAVIEAFAGFRDLARERFRSVTHYNGYDPYSDLYLAHENLGTLALEDGDPYQALVELRRARALVSSQVVGLPDDVAKFLRSIDAEYSNSIGVIYDRLGWTDLALDSVMHALEMDPTVPEAHFDEGMLLTRRGQSAAALASFRDAVSLDPGFAEAQLMLAASLASAGQCKEAAEALEHARSPRGLPRRSYPHEVGTGELHDAAITRRRNIENVPTQEEVDAGIASCRSAAPPVVAGL